jgi:hypothetical protein
MTRTIFLITSITITALAVAVPSAFGNAIIHDHGDATQAKLVAQTSPSEIIRDHGDATQAKLVAQGAAVVVVRDHGDATQAKLTRLSGPVVTPEILRDHGSAEQAKLDAQSSGTTSVVESTSGSELDWSQLAIGFGVGMLLVLGLVVGVQFARNERLAH